MWTTLALMMWVVVVSGYWVVVGIWVSRTFADEQVVEAEDAYYGRGAYARQCKENSSIPFAHDRGI